ncbi:MAG: AraC family transcriptional regulator [Clostridia bacterium]|nr:AraC family transcriptional regulator [Clostridia bacterium]
MYIYKSEECMTGSLPFSISKGEFKAGHEVKIHKHEFIELVYVTSGKSTHYINDISYEANSGDIVFVNYNETHRIVANEPLIYYNLFVKPEYISEKLADAETIYDVFSFFIMGNYFDESVKNAPLTHLSPAQKSEMDSLTKEMCSEVSKREPGFELALDGYMRLIFSRIIRSLRQSDSTKIRSSITPELLDYIDKNYTKNLTLSELASKCFYNSAYLGRLFKNTFNMSLKDYIIQKRADYAKKLLETTDETVETISSLVGYADKKQFYHVFKEKYGCTPGQYRDKL